MPRLGPGQALFLLVASGCLAAGAGEEGSSAGDLVVRRDTFQERFVLTGELRAAEAVPLVVPRTPGFQVQLRWMKEDGSEVEAGQRVVEFDNTSFTSDLEDKRLTLAERETDLERTRTEAAAALEDDEFQLEQRRAELEKARVEASIPRELLSARDYQQRQLDLRRAELAVDNAREDLKATRRTKRSEIELSRLEVKQARREIEEAERAIDLLTLKAPASGVLIVEEHPWEGRKFQLGDSLFAGWTVARIPDLTTLQVEAVLHDVDEGKIETGMRAVATPDAFPDLHLEGEVVEVSPVARELTRSSLRRYFLARIDLDGADPRRLRPGMSIKVEVFGEARDGVLLAPRRALDLGVDPPRAYLAVGGDREIRLGPCNPSQCVVEEGLAEGDHLARRQLSKEPSRRKRSR